MNARNLKALFAAAAMMFACPVFAQEPEIIHEIPVETDVWGETLWGSDLPSCYLQVEALWLIRDRTDRRLLSERSSQADPATPIQTLTTNSFDFQFAPGLKVLVGKPLDESHSVEVNYFGLNNWFQRETVSITTDTNLEEQTQSPFLGTTIVNGQQQFAYDSMLNNVELNLRREAAVSEYRMLSWLVGFRYLSLNESFSAVNEQVQLVDPMGQFIGTLSDERGRAQTYNNLIGLQVGADLTEAFGPMILGIHGTAGAYANLAKSTYTHRNIIDGTFNPDLSAGVLSQTNTDIAGVFTLGFDSVFRITNGISLRFAYEFFVATGLALAPDQAQPVVVQVDPAVTVNFAPGNNFDQDGLIFLHGPSVGLLFVW